MDEDDEGGWGWTYHRVQHLPSQGLPDEQSRYRRRNRRSWCRRHSMELGGIGSHRKGTTARC